MKINEYKRADWLGGCPSCKYGNMHTGIKKGKCEVTCFCVMRGETLGDNFRCLLYKQKEKDI